MLKNSVGLVRDSKQGPLAPTARIIPLDQLADIRYPYQVYTHTHCLTEYVVVIYCYNYIFLPDNRTEEY